MKPARSPLNRQTAPKVIRLFDYCFKRGVVDACEFGDDYTVKEWLNARMADGGFGLLSDTESEYDWKRWRFTIYRWCRYARMGTLGENYIDGIRSKNTFLYVAIPMSMRFYLMGVSEWIDYPNPGNLEIFKNTPKIHWKPVPKHLKVMRTDDFISYIQEFVYEFKGKITEEEKYPTETMLDGFAQCVWQHTRKYATYGEYRDNIEAGEEN